MADQYYILTTKFSDCLNRLVESGRFHHLRRAQPDSGPFLDKVAGLPKDGRPQLQFVLFDRVPSSDTFRKLKAIYELEDVFLDEEAGPYKGQEQYTLLLRKVQDLEPPIPFGQGTALWESLDTTRGRKTTTFYNGGRMILPLPQEDFLAILSFRAEPDALEPDTDGSLAPESWKPGIELPVESVLHAYLTENLDDIEEGLEPYDVENYVERRTDDGGRIDLLCKDRQGAIVVIELKKGRADDAVVGQLARYIGWVKERLANGSAVRGIIIANVVSDRLRYASKAFPDVRLLSYEVKFSLRVVE